MEYNRMVMHNHNAGITVAVEMDEEGFLRAAIASVSSKKDAEGYRDSFIRKRGFRMANGRLTAAANKGDVPMTFSLGYVRDFKSKNLNKEIFGPIRDVIRKQRRHPSITSLVKKIGKSLTLDEQKNAIDWDAISGEFRPVAGEETAIA